MVRVLIGALALACVPTFASAQCTAPTNPATGLRLERCMRGADPYAVLRVDLGTGDLGVRVSRPSERGVDADRWAAGVDGVVAVVPAAEFAFPAFRPEGLTVGGGEAWADTRDDGGHAIVGFDNRAVAIFAPPEQLVPIESWMHDVLSGRAVLRDGVPAADCAGRGCDARPRTGVGLSADARHLVLLSIGGRGVSDPELGAMLREHGADDGLCTGDGAVSAMRVAGEYVVASSDGMPRPSAAHLAIVDQGMGALGDIRGTIRDFATNAPLLDATFSVETLDGEVVATGPVRTGDAFWQANVPVRLYRVRGRAPGYRAGCKICQVQPVGEVWCSVFPERGEGAVECEPEPRTLEVGPWPVASDAGVAPDGGVDAGRPGGRSVGCSAAAGSAGASGMPGLVLGLLLLRRRRP